MTPVAATSTRRANLRLLGGFAAGAGVGLSACRPERGQAAAAAAPASYRALMGGGPWLNTAPLRPEDLGGKVVLVNFWTYTCINSLRPLPYVRRWAELYRDRGLVVVGVHTPEFEVEKDVANVRRALADQGVTYPVVLDSDYRIWRAFDNEAWPAFYFVGADGRMRDRKLGENGYDASERRIQQLLSEARGAPVTDAIVPVAGTGPQAAPDWAHLGSGETYVGYGKATGFASPGGARPDAPSLYRAAPSLPLNHWSLAGRWTMGTEFTTLIAAPGAIAFRFHARDLHLVMGPGAAGKPVRFRVRLDGAAPGADHGADTDAEGRGRLDQPRMYQLVRQARPVADRTFEIEFQDPGARAYVFTFG